MSSASATLAAPASSERSIWTSRISSLLGFLPLGVWTVNHLWDNLAAFTSPDAWQEAVTQHPHPVAHLATFLVVMVPLLAHTAWGIGRLFSFKPALREKHMGNLKYLVQRLSAIGLLGFLGAHLWLAMFRPRLVLGHAEKFTDIAAHMRHHPPTTAVYVLGVLGVAYHLANGLSSLAFRWGLISGRQSERRMDIIVYVSFVLLTAMGLAAVYALWDAGGPLPAPEV